MKKICALILTLFICVTLTACGNPAEKFEEYVKDGKYAEAIEIYMADINGDASSEVKTEIFLEEYLDESWSKYAEESISKEEFDAVFKTLEKIDSKLDILGWALDEVAEIYPIMEQSKESYENGLKLLESGEYTAAMESFYEVAPIDEKNYEDAWSQCENAEQLYVEEIVAECEKRIAAGDYEYAVDLIDSAYYYIEFNSYPELDAVEAEALTGKADSMIHAYAESGEYAEMIEVYNEAAYELFLPISADITKFVTDTVSSYRQDVIDRSVTAYKSSGYEAAIRVIGEGLSELEEDSRLLAYDDLYKSCIPVKFSDVTMLKSNTSWGPFFKSSVEDAYGNQYDGPYVDLCSYSGDETYFELFLDGQYESFSATYFARDGMPDSFSIKFRIYADGVEIYSSDAMYRTSEPVTIELDVTNVRTLRLEAYSSDHTWWDENPGVEVVNGVFTRGVLTDNELN